MNELQIFNNPEFGEIRAIEIDGEPWFVGKDVAAALGYSNTKDAISRHVDDEDKRGSRITTPSGEQTMTIINESGVYSLVLSSKLPGAKTLYVGKFADGTINDRTGNAWWITEDEETSDGCYGYYKGRFKDGDVASTKGYEYNISQDKINEILKKTGKDSLGLSWRQVGENKV